MEKQDFVDVWQSAIVAGRAAAAACVPKPMVVSGYEDQPVMDGVCGFAWVTIRPATSAFARWLKSLKLVDKAYGGGVMAWIGDYNQSMTKKEAHAQAMAEVLRSHGINAYADSRMD